MAGQQLRDAWMPQPDAFAGPLQLLISCRSGGARYAAVFVGYQTEKSWNVCHPMM
jgi:hypothetical protein